MADLVVTTDFTQVNNLNTALKSTDTIFVKAVDSVVRESNRFNRITKVLAKTTEETLAVVQKAEEIVAAKVQQESLKREKARLKEAAAAEREAKRVEAAAKKVADAEAKAAAAQEAAAQKAQRIAATNRAETGFALGMQKAGEIAKQEQELERLKVKYNQVYAASRLYETSLEEINRAHTLGATSTKQHEAALEQLNTEYQNFQNGIVQAGNRFTQHINQASTGMNKMGVVAQQTGYQVSDFIVQVQSGTSPFVAFSQQATQLAGLLQYLPPAFQNAKIGMLGFSMSMATATAGVTILIPLLTMLAMNFFNSGKESEEASKKLDRQTQAYDNLVSKIEELRLARQMEASGAQSADEQVTLNELNRLLQERAEIQARINKLNAIGSRATAFTKDEEAKKAALQVELDLNQAVIDTIVAERQETERINRLNQIRTNQTLEELADKKRLVQAHAAQVQLMGSQLAAQQQMTADAQATMEKYGKMRSLSVNISAIAREIRMLGAQKDAEGFNKAIEEALSAGIKFSLVDLSSIVALAARNGWDLAAALTAAYNVAASKNPTAASVLIGAGGRPEINTNDMQYRGAVMGAQVDIIQKNRKDAEDAAKAAAKGGKGPSEDAVNNKLEEVYKYLEVSKYLVEQENIAYQQRQDTLEMALQKKLLTQQEYNQLELDLASKHARDIADIENKAKVQKLSTVLGAGEQILQAVGQQNEKAAKMARIFGAAQALADTYAGAAAALKLPFPANIAAAGSIISAGLGFVAAIRSGSTSARASGGSVGSATVASTASAPAPQTVFIDSISPDSLYSGETLINLFEAFYDENDKRGKVFMVAR